MKRGTLEQVAAIAELGWALSHMNPEDRDERWVEQTRHLANERFSQSRDTPLHVAAQSGHARLIAGLVAAGVDANATNSFGDTALHTAVRSLATEVVSQLLQSPAVDPNAMGDVGQTPMHVAASSGSVDILQQMLQNRRVDRTSTDFAETPLLCTAAAFGRESVVQLLLADGFYPDLAGADGNAPLHQASRRGHVHVAELLLAAGADPRATNANGDSPARLAAQQGHAAVVECIRHAEHRAVPHHYGAYLQVGEQVQTPPPARARAATL